MDRNANKNEFERLRQEAEKEIQETTAANGGIHSMSKVDLQHLTHELQVHEVELQMQNETLRQTRAELEQTRDRYADLYDFAPVGYISIDMDGVIRSANRTAAALLTARRPDLIGQRFSGYIAGEDRDSYLRFLDPLQNRQAHGWEEVRLIKTDGDRFHARLEGHLMGAESGEHAEILLCLSDISEKKQTEAELKKTRDQLRELAGHLQNVREEEQSAIAREIHDEMGQVLVYLKMSLSAIEDRIPESDTDTRKRIRTMKESLGEIIKTTKNLITRLRPYMLDELGLIAALESYTRDFQEKSGIQTYLFVSSKDLSFNREKETAVYRIVQEALSNVARHSGASYVVVNISKTGKEIALEVSDDGSGFEQKDGSIKTTHGLMGMRERALVFDGEIFIDSEPGRGTRLTARIPA